MRIASADDANTPSSKTSDRVAKNAGSRSTIATTARISGVDAPVPASPRTGGRRSASRVVIAARYRAAVREVFGGRMVRSPAVGSACGSSHGTNDRVLAKHIFVTGGVASSLGKGLTASSLGRLLKARGLRVTMQKLDPYINVDPGTMNPFQHGEVFVTDDGGETDLDLGHYERFVDVPLTRQVERHHRLDLPGRCSPRSAAATTSARPCR